MKKKFAVLFLIILLGGISVFSSNSSWKLAINKAGIKIYTRPVEGFPLEEFRGITEINTDLATIERVLRDVSSQPKWMADCMHAKVLKTFNTDHVVCYNVIDLPWPLDNRDLLINTQFVKSADGKELAVNMTVYSEDIIPVSKKYVRIRQFRAVCRVKELSENKCFVEYINRVNPMAPLPDSLANSFAKDNPFNTLRGMKRMVKLSKYSGK